MDLLAIVRTRALLADADIVQLHSSKAGAVGRLAAATLTRRRPPIIFTPHGWSWFVGGRLGPLYKRFERWAARRADVITPVSALELAQGLKILGGEAKFKLMENGVDLVEYSGIGDTAPRSVDPLLVQVGRLAAQKGQDRSIRALALLSDKRVRLRLVGDGPEHQALAKVAQACGVAERVEFVGASDPRPHLRAADVVVLPSRWEGMSLVLLEAMAVGKAIVHSNCGGSDVLRGCGVLIEHRDDEVSIAELVCHLSRLLDSPSERVELGRLARQRVEERHSLSRVTSGYARLWDELASTEFR
jgi:glycosyltransferase involved in cell wall biosynthesis